MERGNLWLIIEFLLMAISLKSTGVLNNKHNHKDCFCQCGIWLSLSPCQILPQTEKGHFDFDLELTLFVYFMSFSCLDLEKQLFDT